MTTNTIHTDTMHTTGDGQTDHEPAAIEVRGARVHTLAGIDISIPLHRLVGVAGVSGSGKSSLALGVLYAEGSRRYLDALSTYTRRRMTQAEHAQVESVRFLPPALALRQRPGAGGVRSTFGTSTELLNVLRLMFSRLASHRCPNGHYHQPTMAVAAEMPIRCEVCGEPIHAPGAEMLAFNSTGACPTCQGTGIVRTVDDASLVPDPSLTIDQGAVVPWRTFGFNVQPDIVREFGVRTDVPWSRLSDHERDIVFNGPEEKKHITITSVKGVHHLDFTFRNARLTVRKELDRATDQRRLAKVEKFVVEQVCPDCAGSRLNAVARAPRINGHNLAEVTAWSLSAILRWAPTISATLPQEMRAMADDLVDTLEHMGKRLIQLGLGYLTLDRPTASLSTGERQRANLARAVRNETTGVLYVLDEPSTGLHPADIEGLVGVMHDLLDAGNSVVFVDHDVHVLRAADQIIELGPGAGRQGGHVVAQGSIGEIEKNPHSRIAGFLTGGEQVVVRDRLALPNTEDRSAWITMSTGPIHTVHPLKVAIPRGRMTAVTGVSGSGKTTMVLESLIPGLEALAAQRALPEHVRALQSHGIDRVRLVDSTPIGINVRSTVATYCGVMDLLRRAFARTPAAREQGLTVSAFSYNTGSMRCPQCDGTGRIDLDVQFLPDVTITCPACSGTRYRPQIDAFRVILPGRPGGLSLPQVLGLDVDEALQLFGHEAGHPRAVDQSAVDRPASDRPALDGTGAEDSTAVMPETIRRRIHKALQALSDLGLGYLTLGEDTPSLSGGEAQRLKLSNELGRRQNTSLFVLDEPTTGLHPLDVRTLIGVLQRLIGHGATVLFIEHDLDMVANADYVIDMGPGGGAEGGRIVASGTPQELMHSPASLTGHYLARHMRAES